MEWRGYGSRAGCGRWGLAGFTCSTAGGVRQGLPVVWFSRVQFNTSYPTQPSPGCRTLPESSSGSAGAAAGSSSGAAAGSSSGAAAGSSVGPAAGCSAGPAAGFGNAHLGGLGEAWAREMGRDAGGGTAEPHGPECVPRCGCQGQGQREEGTCRGGGRVRGRAGRDRGD